MPVRIPRRGVLATGAALFVGTIARFPARGMLGADTVKMAGKNPRLIVHKAEPLEAETPLDLLATKSVTQVEDLFVRNNQQPTWASTLDPYHGEAPWTLEVIGLTEFPRTIRLPELQAMPQVEHEMVLQCSGNGRSQFSRSAPAKGAPWRHGAMGNVRFRGVTLRSVFEKFAVHPHPTAQYLTAEGADSPAKPADADFEHSIPLRDALDRTLLALELNGKPLPALHGGPLRLVTPGYYGTMHVKWLSRLRLEAQETVNHHQVKRYRTPRTPIEPGSEFDYGLDNSEPNWNMRIKSVLFVPAEGEKWTTGRGTIRGVAWNDGLARIEAVEYSLDQGQSWQRAELERPQSRYAWYPFQMELKLNRGEHTVFCRAIDTLGRTQPLDGSIDWNPAGYGWHGADSAKITVS